MSQNGLTHFKNLAANAARFLKNIRPFWDIMQERVNIMILLTEASAGSALQASALNSGCVQV